MRRVYEEFLDIEGATGLTRDDIIVSQTEETEEDFFGGNPTEWYSKVLADGFNCILAISIHSLLSIDKDKASIRMLRDIISKLTLRYEKSQWNISMVRNSLTDAYIQKNGIPTETSLEGIFSDAFNKEPMYAKVALKFDGTPENFLDLYYKLARIQTNLLVSQHLWEQRVHFSILKHVEHPTPGWTYVGYGCEIISMIRNYISPILSSNAYQKPYKNCVNVLGELLYGLGLWSGTKEEFKKRVRKWAENKKKLLLNEDFIGPVDIQGDLAVKTTENESVFLDNGFSDFCIIRLSKDFLSQKQKIKTMVVKLRQELRLMLSKCRVELIATDERTALELDCREMNSEEKIQSEECIRDNAKAIILIQFDCPKNFKSLCQVASKIDEIKDLTLSSYKSPDMILIGHQTIGRQIETIPFMTQAFRLIDDDIVRKMFSQEYNKVLEFIRVKNED